MDMAAGFLSRIESRNAGIDNIRASTGENLLEIVRKIQEQHSSDISELKKNIGEQAKKIEELKKKDEEKTQIIGEQAKKIEELTKKDEEKTQIINEQATKIAGLETRIQHLETQGANYQVKFHSHSIRNLWQGFLLAVLVRAGIRNAADVENLSAGKLLRVLEENQDKYSSFVKGLTKRSLPSYERLKQLVAPVINKANKDVHSSTREDMLLEARKTGIREYQQIWEFLDWGNWNDQESNNTNSN